MKCKFDDTTYLTNICGSFCRFTLPPFLTLKNFEGLDLGKMDKVGLLSDFPN